VNVGFIYAKMRKDTPLTQNEKVIGVTYSTHVICVRERNFLQFFFLSLPFDTGNLHHRGYLHQPRGIFFRIAAGTTGLWVVLMPAFVNSCHNLNVAFYSWSEDRYVTNRFTNCFYPFEIKADVKDRNSICSCMLGKKTADVIEGGVEVVAIAVEAQ